MLALAGMLSACASLEFYRQAAAGRFEIWRRAQPIAALLADPRWHPRSARLELVEQARRFAQDELDLPSAGSYHSYADLERDYVVWNVFAAPFDLAPHRSCFPIAGCVDYRGYFTRPAAERYA